MTERERALTAHLAVVCGWPVGNYSNASRELATSKLLGFDPIYDPRDTSIVMEAWRKQGKSLRMYITGNSFSADCYPHFHSYGPSWTEAVCEAIGRASGYDGEGK